ncbi:hypothetical protein DVH05_020766 [Phytophthora capsici]|nr:hypothetical protein DVH05_020766 [Phytophthora capsici]
MLLLSFTENEDQEGDSTSASALPQCVPAQPVADLTSGAGPDPDLDPTLAAACGLKASPPGTFSRQLHLHVLQKHMGDAEQLLTELVITKFPRLIDAMHKYLLMFTQLIAGGDISLVGHRLQDQEDVTAPAVRQDSNGNRRAIFYHTVKIPTWSDRIQPEPVSLY